MSRRYIAIASILAAALLLLGDFRSDFRDDAEFYRGRRLLSPSENAQGPKTADDEAVLESDGAQELVVATSDPIVPPSGWATTNWIDIHQFAEGISGWKVTLLQVLETIDRIPHATLVEPCMAGGRLVSCGRPYPDELKGSPVPVSRVLDVSWALEPREGGGTPPMALYEDFLRRTDGGRKVRRYQICLKASQPECPEPFVDAKISGKAFANQADDDEISVFQFYMCWWGRCALEITKKFASNLTNGRGIDIPPEERRASLKIHPDNFETVREVLEKADIMGHYSLIQWRGERKGMDYVKCAEHVVRAKGNMKDKLSGGEDGADKDDDHPFLLMTSISEDISMQWNGELIKDRSSNGSPKEALDILRKDGFLRFDQLLKEADLPLQDVGMLAVYELALTTMSKTFATCSHGGTGPGKGSGLPPGCTEEQMHFCRECNYIGKFARLAMDTRLAEQGLEESTYGCWPL